MAGWADRFRNLGGLAGLGTLVGGVGSAFGAAAQRRQQQQQQAINNALLRYNAQAEARAAQAAAAKAQIDAAQAAAVNLAAAMPLGAEQVLAQRNAKAFGMMQGMAGRPTPSGYGGIFNPFTTMDRTAWSPEATAAAIQQRRKVAAGIDPRFQFDSMGAYGLGDTTAADRGVADYQAMLQKESADRQARLDALLAEQMAAANAFDPNKVLQQSGGNHNVRNAILRLAGAVAPAAYSAMRAPSGTPPWKTFASAMSTPAALARVAGAAIGGPVGSALQIGSSFIRPPQSAPAPVAGYDSSQLTPEQLQLIFEQFGIAPDQPSGIEPGRRALAAIRYPYRIPPNIFDSIRF